MGEHSKDTEPAEMMRALAVTVFSEGTRRLARGFTRVHDALAKIPGFTDWHMVAMLEEQGG